ncbi:MAG TPA: DUF975 family protein [Pyrinomonadaceae bacterium]|nr:DUF975 family protein [Pyrinomonadaceae bacterium]
MTTPDIPYNRKVVDPVECIKAGWELVKPQYWLFVGMTFVAFFIGSAVPFGILMGPLMCGIYLTCFARRRGEPVEFGLLFKGFDFFVPSLVATLLHALPIVAILIPTYVLFYASMVLALVAQGDNPNPIALLGVLGTFSLIIVVVVLLIIFVSVGFTFAYPLIVDRRLRGWDAVKLSFKAAMANFWRLLAMGLLTGVMAMVGMAFCYVGMYLVFPISYGAIASAYEQVFGLAHTREDSNLPPPPPTFE